MAVFIALFFQVLFVFFAMAINVGLVVHDKINLQNSVDFAAYYGAAKQAEILNQIAHINYQMRQNYKLLVWRYRVLGTLIRRGHPFRDGFLRPEGDITSSLPPAVCVAGDYWHEYRATDPIAMGFCTDIDINIPNIPPVSTGGGIVGGMPSLIDMVDNVIVTGIEKCKEAAILNWAWAARMLAHFRVDGYVRKEKITLLAGNLSSPNNQFKDLRNELVETGVRNTFEYNLTESNRNGITKFEYFNSMTQGECSTPKRWLPEIRINPVIAYVNLTHVPGGAGGCLGPVSFNRGGGVPSGLSEVQFSRYRDHILMSHWQGEPSGKFHSSVGFEKNPWCVVYSGVSASTEVRKPFSPGSGTVELKAHGFAKPFGGRIGPWYGKLWPQGARNSQAGSRSDLVDMLLPSRDVPGGGGGSINPDDDLANYSRFPGDGLGLKSGRAVSAMAGTFSTQIPKPTGVGVPGPLAWSTYNHLGDARIYSTGDSLARNTPLFPAVQRDFEVAAVAPDVFDALYCSIEPAYFDNYFTSAATNGGAFFQPNQKIYDFGSTKDGGQPLAPENFSVIEQVRKAKELYHPGVNYFIKDWQHLLTSWHQKEVTDYNITSKKFGKCEAKVLDGKRSQFPTTGNCINGGRTGYSVKSVSMDFLLSSDHELSGGSGGKGPILNPPSL